LRSLRWLCIASITTGLGRRFTREWLVDVFSSPQTYHLNQILTLITQYNAITRSIEAELIPTCRRYGLDIVVYNPVAGGLFSGKYKTTDVPSSGRFSDAEGTRGGMYRKRYFKDATFEALAVIEPVVAKHNLTLLETAFRWVIHHSQLNIKDGGNDGIIIGVSSEAQLEGNLKDVEKGPLPQEVLEALDEAWKIAQPTTANYWHLDLKYTYDVREALK
jgi:aflatoxin B1 aldehyde reductase